MTSKSNPLMTPDELAKEVWEDESPTSYLAGDAEPGARRVDVTNARDERRDA